MSFYKITIQPQGKVITCSSEENLLTSLHKANLPFVTDCGGAGKCGRCAVKVLDGEYFSLPHHRGSLEENWSLACRTKPLTNLTIWLPETGEITVDASRKKITQEFSLSQPSDPFVKVVEIEVPAPSETDNASDFTRFLRILDKSEFDFQDISLSSLKKLPHIIRTSASISVCLDYLRKQIIDLSSTPKKYYTLAIDLGTTTIDMLLIDLEDGNAVIRGGGANLQMAYGSDIIHRIISASKKGNLRRLQEMTLLTINNILKQMLKYLNIKNEDIIASRVSGNTTMIHLLLALDPTNIRLSPYVPAATAFPTLSAKEIGMRIFPDAPVYIVPGLSSYVGGDIISGLSTLDLSGKLTLYLDLGTNGEIVIGNGDWFMGCACSCGPAFEGGGITCGMRAAPGAIERIKVTTEGELDYITIGGISPLGICGSGLIDLLAGLFLGGIIDGKGRLKKASLPHKITNVGRRKAFAIELSGEHCLLLDEADIDNLIRTKAALMAGIRSLLKEVSLTVSDLERIYIAGNFGAHLDIENAIALGLLPDLARDKFEFIGNASLRGAYFILTSQEYRLKAKKLAQKITNIELSTLSGYTEEFIAACFLPHTDLHLFPSSNFCHS